MPVFRYAHRVTADCTLGNHIYYSRYLDLLEAARGEFFRRMGATFSRWQEQNAIFPVTECRLRYRLPAGYDELLSIELQVTAAQGARLQFSYRVLNESDALVLEGETLHACTDLNGKPKRLPRELRERLSDYLA
jgi:acyl-CoA thioester hydrolase